MLVNIALVSHGRPESRITRTASATDPLTPPVSSPPEGLMLIATITRPPCHASLMLRIGHHHEGAAMSEQQSQQAVPASPAGSYLGQSQGNAIFEARFKRHTGMLLMSRTTTLTVRGTLEQVRTV
jgi:hypothetical protein